MTIQINQPELEALIRERLKGGAFQDAEALLLAALKSTPEGEPLQSSRRKTRAEAVAHIRQMRQGNRLPPGVTIKDLINEGRA